MQKHFYLFTAITLLFITNSAAQKFTISGYVSDKKTGERLRGASIYLTDKNGGTTTNNFGFYSITQPADSVTLLITYTGFTPFEKRLLLNKDYAIDASMEPVAAL